MICSVLYHSIENQKAKGGCKIFNIQNISLAKYSYSNMMASRCKSKKEKAYEKCPEKMQSFSEVH